MILTVTLNPMLDKTVTVDGFGAPITRASAVEMVVGGKGVNVARQLSRLGVDAVATGLLGGEIGMMLRRLMDEEGLHHDFYPIAALTREGVTYRTPAGETRAVFEPPHRVTPEEARGFVEWLQQYIVQASMQGSWQASWLVCSGSSPDASCDALYRELIGRAGTEGLSTVLDSYGKAFQLGLESHPTMVKPNKSEFEQTFGRKLGSAEDYPGALRELLVHATYALITDGGAPFYAGAPGGLWRCTPPAVRAVNPTGSGDSMVAGILWGLVHGRSFEESLRLGAAAGACNASVWQVAASSEQEILRLLPGVTVERLG